MGNPFSTWLSSAEEESASASASEDTFPDIVKERYHIVRKIGKGAFGSVYEVRDKRSNAKFAMKKLAHSNKGNEALLQVGCEGEYVVKLFETILHEASESYFIVMELCERGNLRDWMRRVKSNKLQSETVVLQMLLEICTAVESCHQNNVIHRDLKPENILINSVGRLKLTDFGVAKLMKASLGASTFCGTPAYMAPELYLSYISKMGGASMQKYDYKCDVWSIGCILLEMAAEKEITVFHQKNRQETDEEPVLGYNVSQLSTGDSEDILRSTVDKYVPQDYYITRKLISQMLVRQPDKRIDVKDILLDSDIHKKLENPPEGRWYDGLSGQGSAV